MLRTRLSGSRLILIVCPFIFSFLIAAIYYVFSAYWHQGGTSTQRLMIERSLVELGQVRPSSQHHVKYKLKNDGHDDLRIFGVKSSCGCTGAALSRSEIPPGENAILNVDFTAPSASGISANTIQFQTNDKQNPSVTLRFTAVVGWDVHFTPSHLQFSRYQMGESQKSKQVIEVTSNSGTPFEIDRIDVSDSWITCRELVSESAKKVFEVELDMKKLRSAESIRGWLSLGLDHSDRQVITIPVVVSELTRPSVIPSVINFGFVNKLDLKPMQVLVGNLEPDAPLSVRPTSEAWSVKGWEVERSGAGGLLRLMVRCPELEGYNATSLELLVGGSVVPLKVTCYVTSEE